METKFLKVPTFQAFADLNQERRNRGACGGLRPPPPSNFKQNIKNLNNESSISELQDFKLFWGRIPQTPLKVGASGASE